MTMCKANTNEVKEHLAAYVRRAETGETIILTRYNRPVAQLAPLDRPARKRRPAGLCAGELRVPDDFNDPLPEEVVAAFEGQ